MRFNGTKAMNIKVRRVAQMQRMSSNFLAGKLLDTPALYTSVCSADVGVGGVEMR